MSDTYVNVSASALPYLPNTEAKHVARVIIYTIEAQQK